MVSLIYGESDYHPKLNWRGAGQLTCLFTLVVLKMGLGAWDLCMALSETHLPSQAKSGRLRSLAWMSHFLRSLSYRAPSTEMASLAFSPYVFRTRIWLSQFRILSLCLVGDGRQMLFSCVPPAPECSCYGADFPQVLTIARVEHAQGRFPVGIRRLIYVTSKLGIRWELRIWGRTLIETVSIRYLFWNLCDKPRGRFVASENIVSSEGIVVNPGKLKQ